MVELRRLGVLSVAKINAVLSAFMGFILGIIYAGMGAIMDAAGTPIFKGISPVLLGFGFVLALPVLYGIFGFISGIVFAALYNLFASLFGGIEMKFRAEKK